MFPFSDFKNVEYALKNPPKKNIQLIIGLKIKIQRYTSYDRLGRRRDELDTIAMNAVESEFIDLVVHKHTSNIGGIPTEPEMYDLRDTTTKKKKVCIYFPFVLILASNL